MIKQIAKSTFFILAFCTLVATPGWADDTYEQQVTLLLPAKNQHVVNQCVVLLHGLARSSSSMSKLAGRLVDNNYVVVNIDYPSRRFPIEVLSNNVVRAGMQACEAAGADNINFVTHSLGGILLRHYSKHASAFSIERAVLLGPPNNGSEVVDSMRDVPGYEWLNGPAGQQLGTGTDSVPVSLGALDFNAAVIAGTSSINPVLSTYLPNPDDGKVSVASSRVVNMCAHLQMAVSHPYLMKDDDVIDEVVSYLSSGRFASSAAEYPECSFR